MTWWSRAGGRPEGTAVAAPSARRPPARPSRRTAALLVSSALTVAACGAASTPVTIGPASSGAGPACVEEAGQQVCVTGAATAVPVTGADGSTATGTPPDTATPTPTRTRTARTSTTTAKAWGGGTRVGSFATRGTVRGVQSGDSGQIRARGTCVVARDVRTITAALADDTELVVQVTGRRVASVTLATRGGTRWQADYVGTSAAQVVTLTPTRTIVRDARLVRTDGPDAPPVTVDADFDC